VSWYPAGTNTTAKPPEGMTLLALLPEAVTAQVQVDDPAVMQKYMSSVRPAAAESDDGRLIDAAPWGSTGWCGPGGR
jgi:hypothetical protein